MFKRKTITKEDVIKYFENWSNQELNNFVAGVKLINKGKHIINDDIGFTMDFLSNKIKIDEHIDNGSKIPVKTIK